jgi:coenzyme F420-dependent glucose-6-phosphate dehydrogenase
VGVVGFHCSHEQHAPSALLGLAARANAAGFTAAMCSDHVSPFLPQGQSGYAWSWLGAALQATTMTFGTVCAPGQRYHPAIVAQAAATLSEMYPDRFWLALGSGEALNESITADPWPPRDMRYQRLRECVDIIRALWAGEEVTDAGLVRIKRARVYSRPARPPLLLAAAMTPETARWAASWADGLITASGPRHRLRAIVDAFSDAGGAGKPLYLQVALSYAKTDDDSQRLACEHWPQAALPPARLAELETPDDFERAVRTVSPSEVLSAVRASADVERHAAWLREDLDMGFTRIYLHNVNPDHERFFEDFAPRIAALTTD